MGIKISQGFTRTGKFPIDETLLLTKAQMLAINDALMPEKYFTLCLDDGKFYIYDKNTTTPSVETGKFKVFEGGSGTDDYNDLINQPTLEGEVIKGDMSLSDFGILSESEIEDLINSRIEDSEGNLIFYTKDETYSKDEVYSKDETYSKDEVYSKDETYSKEELYTKEEVDDLIEVLPKFKIEVVDELPTKDISDTTIYLLRNTDSEGNNFFDEYIYVNKRWELIGTTKVDLSNYYTIDEVNSIIDAINNNIDDLADIVDSDGDRITSLEVLLDSEGNRITVLEDKVTVLEDKVDNLEIPSFEVLEDSEGNPVVSIARDDGDSSITFNSNDDGITISVKDGDVEASKDLVSKEYVDDKIEGEHIELTQAEYDALPPDKKLDGTVYFVTDGEGGGSLPPGGTTGQVLTKKSDADWDVEWKNLAVTEDSNILTAPDGSKFKLKVANDGSLSTEAVV